MIKKSGFSTATAILASFLFVFFAEEALAEEILSKRKKYRNAVAIQLGVNGNLADSNSYELAIIPPDVSYSHEIFHDKKFNIAATAFYDNIALKIKDTHFAYRVGAKIDAGFELGQYTPYLTFGFGVMRYGHHYQTSPIYGGGILQRLSDRISWVNELNFQNVRYQNSGYEIVNFTTGIAYSF